jgi:regulator of protease activity HflC (stomatin/prohibitin superfamily)
MFEIVAVLTFVSIALLLSSLKIVPEYERLVVFRFGHLLGPRGPGLQVILPFIEHYTKIDMRVSSIPIELHEVITKDDVILKIDAVCLFQITNPKLVVNNVREPQPVTEELVRSGLSGALRQNDLADIERSQNIILKRLASAIDRQTSTLGIKVNSIQIKGIEILRASNGRKVGTKLATDKLQIAEQILAAKESKFELTDFEEPIPASSDTNGGDYQYGHATYSYGHGLYEFGHKIAAEPEVDEA